MQHLEKTDAAAIAKGRRLVAGELADDHSMRSSFCICAYLESNRAKVRWRGCCGHDDDAAAWVRPGDGVACCLHTREPCPKAALAELLKLWDLVNKPKRKRRKATRK